MSIYRMAAIVVAILITTGEALFFAGTTVVAN
jgi:hypothetical protein